MRWPCHYPDTNAAAIVEVLGGDFVERLHRLLDDPTNYGMAKSMYMAGEMLGFDMTSQEGLLQYQAAFNGMLEKTRTMAISETEMHYSQKPNSDTLKKMRKDKRKERQAKKKNRARR